MPFWILGGRRFVIRRKPRPKPAGPDVERMRASAHEQLPPRARELASKYGFRPVRIFIRNNRTNWGSCSSKGNINLNLHLMKVSPELRDYVILHELCHLRHLNHGPEFHALLNELCMAELGEPEKSLGARLKRQKVL